MTAIIKETSDGPYIEVLYQSSLCDWAECIARAHAELGEGFKHLPVVAVTARLQAVLND